MNWKRELPLIVIVMLPFVYLAYVWNQLPQEVAMQWGLDGEVSRYGDKFELLFMPFLLPLLTYVILLIVPKIDPKKKLAKMGNKYQSIKVVLVTLMSCIALFIIYSAKSETIADPKYIFMLVGALILVLGNYFKTIQPNYFIGIRTPWTLESHAVWKHTHLLAGIMWFVGGLLIIFSSLFFTLKHSTYLCMVIVGVITIVPIVYSYLLFKKKQENTLEQGV